MKAEAIEREGPRYVAAGSFDGAVSIFFSATVRRLPLQHTNVGTADAERMAFGEASRRRPRWLLSYAYQPWRN